MGRESLGEALHALANALRQVAPVHVVCDPSDILATARVRAPGSEKPSVFLYERSPGGVGYSDKLFTHSGRVLELHCCPGVPAAMAVPVVWGRPLKPGRAGKAAP